MAKTQEKADAPAEQERTQLPVQYDVRIFGAKPSGTQRASATVDINGAFAIRGVKVLESSKGLFVAMPQYKVGADYKDICFPCTKESREQFNSAVMKAYEQALTQAQGQSPQISATPEASQTMSGQAM